MEPLKMPKTVYLKGREAVIALSEFIDELEKQRGKTLTDKQTEALIRIANELISNIEAQIKTEAAIPQTEQLSTIVSPKRLASPLTKFFFC